MDELRDRGREDRTDSKPVRVMCIIGIIIFAVAVVAAVYAMSHRMGQLPGFDFGAGQYYYTDIPGWQKYFLVDAYDNQVPLAVLIGLFFAWGFLMYRLWCFLDRKLGDQEKYR